MRVPGRIASSVGRSFMFRPGSRYMVTTVAWLKSVAKMSPCWICARALTAKR